MTCPDELTLDLWLADALPSEEAATTAAHVRTCATCSATVLRAQGLGAQLQAAFALNAEAALLSRLELAARWRTSPVGAAPSWGWFALVAVIGGYVAWLAAAPVFGPVAAAVTRIGLGTVPLHLALVFLFDLGQVLFDLTRHPALGLSQPLLVLFALVLLAWPRQSISQRSTPA